MLGLRAAATHAQQQVVNVGAQSNGSTVTVAVGDTILVKLEAQPGTGFAWHPTAAGSNLLELKSNQFAAATLPGGKSMQELAFVAKAPGNARVALAYRQGWQAQRAGDRTFSLVVIIKAS
jgi:inhibitor of cysteine peptidase